MQILIFFGQLEGRDEVEQNFAALGLMDDNVSWHIMAHFMTQQIRVLFAICGSAVENEGLLSPGSFGVRILQRHFGTFT